MDHALAVRGGKRLRELGRDRERLLKRKPASLQAFRERLPGEMLHHEEHLPLVITDVVQHADVCVVQTSNRLRLALKPGPAFRIAANIRREDFDRDRAVEAGIAGLVDLAHAPGADSRLDLVGSEASPGDEAHVLGLRGALYAAPCRFCAGPEGPASVPEPGCHGGTHDFGQEDYRSSPPPLTPVSDNDVCRDAELLAAPGGFVRLL